VLLSVFQERECLFLNPRLLKKAIANIDPDADLGSIERWDYTGYTSFRYRSRGVPFYFRVAAEPGRSFAPEAEAIRLFDNAGMLVPRVMYVSDVEPETRRAVIVLSALPGASMATSWSPTALLALWEAGQHLARMKAIPTNGFGYLQPIEPRNGEWRAEYATFRSWIKNELILATRNSVEALLGRQRLEAYNQSCGILRTWETPTPVLAHGSMHLRHLFHDGSSFSGLMDFKAILGADEWYDVATLLASLLWSVPGDRSKAKAFMLGYTRQFQLSDHDLELIRHRTITLLPRADIPRGSIVPGFDFLSQPGALARLLRGAP